VDALVVHMGVTGVSFDPQGSVTRVWAGAGESWDGLVQQVVERGLAGLECLSGIPGSVGGTPVQNVGAYGQEVARVIAEVQVYDRVEQREATIPVEACGFGYRTSRFKGGDRDRFVVCGVTFEVRPGNGTATYPDLVAELAADAASATVARVRDAVLAVRRRKGMVLDPQDGDTRSVGSFFTNPVVMSAEVERIEAAQAGQVPSYATETGRRKLSAAWLIEQAGMTRGTTRGAVGLSGKHTLAIVNRGGATASDVVRFAGEIKRRVLDRFGIWLTPEPVFVGFGDDPGVRWLEERGK
jgi:UDP-N-acetylmuramate dehydrogenase